MFHTAKSRFILFLLIFALPLHAQRGRSGPGTGNPKQHLVPWRFLENGAALVIRFVTKTATVTGPVVLYWLPASLDEVEKSPLLTSHVLLEESLRCVGMEIVLPANASIIDKLGAAGSLPAALLVDGHGSVIRRVNNVRGASAVERMLTDELNARDEAMYRDITEAKRRASAGEKASAIELYKKIWDDRCLFPLAGSEAQSALKALGVTVHETPTPPPADPNLRKAPPVTTSTGH